MTESNAMPYEELAFREEPYCPYRPEQTDRVLVLLDLRNITKRLFDDCREADFDFRKLIMDAVGVRRCIAAIAVDGTFYEDETRRSRLQCMIRNSGFRLDLVPSTNSSGKQEGTDVELALTAYEYAKEGRCDCVVLITGDGDFTTLVRRLHEIGVTVEVASFDAGLSGCLRRDADRVLIIDEMPLVRMSPSGAGRVEE